MTLQIYIEIVQYLSVILLTSVINGEHVESGEFLPSALAQPENRLNFIAYFAAAKKNEVFFHVC